MSVPPEPPTSQGGTPPPYPPPQPVAPPATPGWGAPPSPPPPGSGYPYAPPPPTYGGYQVYNPGYGVGSGFDFASGGARIGARLIDLLIGFGVSIVLALVVIIPTMRSSVDSGSTVFAVGPLLAIAGISLVLGFFNEIALVALKGGSVGKLIVGTRIVKDTGEPADWGAALMRYVPNLVGFVPFCGGVLNLALAVANLVMVLGQEPRQSIYDKVGKTYVINAR